jgi:hypothetical protein
MEQKVCDYRNYETFTVAVILENDRQLYQRWRQRGWQLQQLYSATQVEGGYSDACIMLGDEIKEWLTGLCPETIRRADPVINSIFAQLLQGALSAVDWREVAESFLKE